MLRRRFLLAAATASTLWFSACSQAVPTKISVTQEQLQQGLQGHFPKRFPVAGLLQFEMQQPVLQLLPGSNQLQTTVQVMLSGPALRQGFQGTMDVRFALRYRPEDRTVRAHRVEVMSLQLEGAAPAVADMVSTYGTRLAAQALDQFALYTVSAEDLELFNTLGVQPGAITVTDKGLDVAIEPKPAS